VDEDTARQQLLDHAGDLDPEQLRRPRIVLVAGSFPPAPTAAIVWLTEMGVDGTIQNRRGNRTVFAPTAVPVSQLFPVPDVEEFTVSPQRAEIKAVEDRRRRGREQSTVVRLVASRAIPDGTPLRLRPTTEVTADVRAAVENWVKEEPARGRAT